MALATHLATLAFFAAVQPIFSLGNTAVLHDHQAANSSELPASPTGPAPDPKTGLAQKDTKDPAYRMIAPFGKENTAYELQDHAARTQDTLVDAVENAEVAEI